jgi:hypothetical protein
MRARERALSGPSPVLAAKRDQDQSTVLIEVIPRIRFAERLALRSAIGLDGLDRGEALTAIASVLSIAEQWAVAS